MFCLESNKIKKFTVGGVVCVAGGMEHIWAAIFAQDKSTMNLLYGDGFALVLAGRSSLAMGEEWLHHQDNPATI